MRYRHPILDGGHARFRPSGAPPANEISKVGFHHLADQRESLVANRKTRLFQTLDKQQIVFIMLVEIHLAPQQG